jgi:hypothetical protein
VATTLVVSVCTPSIQAHAVTLSTADSCSSVQQSWCSLGVSGHDARCSSMHTPQSTHMHCFVHCRFTAAQLQHSLGAAWSVSGYDARCFSMHASNPRTCIALSTVDSLAAQCSTSLGCSLEREWLRRSLFSIRASAHCQSCSSLQRGAASLGACWGIKVAGSLFRHAPPPVHAHALLSPLQIHCSSVAAQVLGAAWSVIITTLIVQQYTPQSTHMYCFVHCRFTAAQCSTPWVQPGRSGHDIVVSACTPQSTHMCIALSLQIRAARVQHVLVQPGAWWLRRSLFQHIALIHFCMHLLCPPQIHRSSVQRSLGAAWA